MKTGGETERLDKADTATVGETNRNSVEQVEEEQFNYATLSNKIIMAKPDNPEFEITLIIYHSEAGYALRKHIIDKAKAHPIWSKDLKEVSVGEVLAVTAKKSRATEQLFEE
jgi:hypothetical protein